MRDARARLWSRSARVSNGTLSGCRRRVRRNLSNVQPADLEHEIRQQKGHAARPSLSAENRLDAPTPTMLGMVFATASLKNAPSRFVTEAIRIASRAVSTLVETTVAMELAVAWKPLFYSNTNALR